MHRLGGLMLAIMAAGLVLVGGCGGNNSGGGGEPAYIIGTWNGAMTHRVVDYNQGTDVTATYGISFYILSQDGSQVTGKMRLKDDTHVANLSGVMSGDHFTGARTGLHTVKIEFTVDGNTLTGTFRFTGDGLDEWGDYTCTKQ
jgi:hypothetical protein